MNANTTARKRIPLRLRAAAFVLALLALLSPALNAPAQAQSTATVRPVPATLDLRAGETALVEIRLENASNVYGIDVRVEFDPAIIEIVDNDSFFDGAQMRIGSFPKPDFIALNVADNAAGELRYAVTQVNPTPPATGSGVVFSFEVRGRAGGATDLAVTLVEMADREGNLLAVTTGSAAVQVTGPTAAPTGIVLQPTSAPPSGGGEAATTAATSAPATPDAAAPPATIPAAQAPGATPIVATLVAATADPALPPAAGATQPATGDLPATDGAPGEVVLPPANDDARAEPTASGGGATGQETAAGEVAGAAAGPTTAPAVVGGAANLPGQPGVTPAPDGGAGNGSTAALVIGGVAAIGLAGLLFVRMRRRG